MNKKKTPLIVFLSILLATITMILSYSLIDQNVKGSLPIIAVNQTYSSEIYDVSLTSVLPRFYELKKADHEQLQPYELFMKNSENADKTIAQSITNAIYDELNYLDTNYPNLYYYVSDKDKKTVITNAKEENLKTLESLAQGESGKTDDWYLAFSFDNNGIFALSQSSDQNYSSSWVSDRYNAVLRSLFTSENLRLRQALDENGQYALYYNDESLGQYQGPSDVNFSFLIKKADLLNYFGYNISDEFVQSSLYSEYLTGYFSLIFLSLAIVLWVAYRDDPKQLPLYRLYQKIPFELHLFFVFMMFPLIHSMGEIVRYTVSGQHFFLTSGAADNVFELLCLYGLENGILWFLIFAYLAYFCIAIKDILKRKAWREYFMTRKILHWLHVKCKALIQFIKGIDLSKKDDQRITAAILINFCIMSFLIMMWGFGLFFLLFYSIILFVIAKKYLTSVRHDYETLLDVTKHIADGNLDNEIEVDLGIFNDFKNNMVDIRAGFKQAVEEEVHSQRMKSELITNVSHDLKTPLTSIITYIDLLKKENLSEEERNKYIETLDRNSTRLKHLIDDLFEVSKANSGTMKFERMDMDIVSLMKQVQFECQDAFQQRHLEIKNTFSDEKILCYLDPQKTYRIFENLISNIIKYAMEHTRVYIDMIDYGNRVDVTLRNISACEMKFDPEDITERFTRGDASRNTEGSGLGLAIAKSFTELQDGSLRVTIDGDLFKVQLCFARKQETEPTA